MSGTVAMFPGQGLGPRDVSRAEISEVLPDLLARCEELLGRDPFELEEWPTAIAQPITYCASLARWVRDWNDDEPSYVAGHSLGEVTALAAAGGISFGDGLNLVVERGRLTERAVAGTQTGMLAVGIDVAEGERLAQGVDVVLANDNSPHQVVLSGRLEDLESAAQLARAANRRTHFLQVTGAFHSPWVASALAPFREQVERAAPQRPRIPVISSITCEAMDPVADLAAALVSRVRWRELVLTLRDRGADDFRDVGPGTVLGKLARHTLRELEAVH